MRFVAECCSKSAFNRTARALLPRIGTTLTDEESRFMPVAGGGFKQCYNAQAVVALDSLLVVATDVVQAIASRSTPQQGR